MEDLQLTNKILWLASYPKSGNTWFRAFISALQGDGEVEINNLRKSSIFSSRETFESAADVNPRDLYDSEAKCMVADVYRYMAACINDLIIVKVHDTNETDMHGSPIIPANVTQCALYFIRNPLDIAGSLANHMNFSMEQAVQMINNPQACMARQKNNLNQNTQFRQHLSSWSGHVNSWTEHPPFPLMVMRYEDMIENTFDVFSKAVRFIGWQHSADEIATAIEACTFERLSKQEAEKGFVEKSRKSPVFFRSGKKDNWRKELTNDLSDKIIAANSTTMIKFGYI